jgi:hypothetical protein
VRDQGRLGAADGRSHQQSLVPGLAGTFDLADGLVGIADTQPAAGDIGILDFRTAYAADLPAGPEAEGRPAIAIARRARSCGRTGDGR